MSKYKEIYIKLFGAVENAINEIDKFNFGKAKEILIDAQLKAEEIIIENDDIDI